MPCGLAASLSLGACSSAPPRERPLTHVARAVPLLFPQRAASIEHDTSPGHPILADDFREVRGVLFSPDGSLLAVDDDRMEAMGCFGYTLSTIHLYDTTTWKERVVVQPGHALVGWGFSAGGERLLVATRNNIALETEHPVEVAEIDTRTGDVSPSEFDPKDPALPAPSQRAVDSRGLFTVTARDAEVDVIETASGSMAAELGALPKAKVTAEVLPDGSTVLFAVLWSTGEQAVWNATTGAVVSFAPELEAPVKAMALTPSGRVALAEANGAMWRYDFENGALVGRKVAKVLDAVVVGLGETAVFVGTLKGQVVGFNAASGKRMFSATLAGAVPEAIALSDKELDVASRDGTTWTFQVPSGRLIHKYQGIGLLGGGDPNAPIAPFGVDMPVRTTVICDASCWVTVGDSSVLLVAGDVPGSATAWGGVSVELLGKGAESRIRCLRGAVVVALSECAGATAARGLVGVAQKPPL